MKFTTKTGIIGFLLALSTLNASQTKAKVIESDRGKNFSTIESRLAALSEAVRQREAQLSDSLDSNISPTLNNKQYAWANWNKIGEGNWSNVKIWRNRREQPSGSFSNLKQPFSNWNNAWNDIPRFVNYREPS